MNEKHILLIISGGIAAVKLPELIRRLTAQGARITPVLTQSGAQFVAPLSIAALARSKVFTELFDLTEEAQMGHIELSRAADLVLVAPATAQIMAKMAQGMADDLATTLLLATDTPVMIAPSMNVRMWQHPATQRFVRTLVEDVPDERTVQAIRRRHDGRLVTLSFRAESVSQSAVFAELVRREVEFELGHGGVEQVRGRAFGHLTLELRGDAGRVDEAVRAGGALVETREVA